MILKAPNSTNQPTCLENLFIHISRANLAVKMASGSCFCHSTYRKIFINPIDNKLASASPEASTETSGFLFPTSQTFYYTPILSSALIVILASVLTPTLAISCSLFSTAILPCLGMMIFETVKTLA